MANVNSAAIGRGRKSIGNVTYRYINGETIASLKVTKNNSKTEKQTKHRDAFSVVGRMATSLTPALNVGFRSKAKLSKRACFIQECKQLLNYIPESEYVSLEYSGVANVCAALGDPAFTGRIPASNGTLSLVSNFTWDDTLDVTGPIYFGRDFQAYDTVCVVVGISYVLQGSFFEVVRVYKKELTQEDVDKLGVKSEFMIDKENFLDMNMRASIPQECESYEFAVAPIVTSEFDHSVSHFLFMA